MTKKEKAKLVIGKLEQLYVNSDCSLTYTHPYELLIAVRLSAQCTDARVDIITPLLFNKYDTLEKLANAEISDVQDIVKPCGLGKTKGRDIVMLSQMLIRDFNSTLPNNMVDLLKLPGIGRKTANLIMGDIYGEPAIVTDTHCIRITNRLGLSSGTDPLKVELQLKKILDPKKSSDFCHRLVFFGRDVCVARKPRCEKCPFTNMCPHFKKLQKDIEKTTKKNNKK